MPIGWYWLFKTMPCMLTFTITFSIIIVYTGENEENERKSAKRSSEIGGTLMLLLIVRTKFSDLAIRVIIAKISTRN